MSMLFKAAESLGEETRSGQVQTGQPRNRKWCSRQFGQKRIIPWRFEVFADSADKGTEKIGPLEGGGNKPSVSLDSLFDFRSCILNGILSRFFFTNNI